MKRGDLPRRLDKYLRDSGRFSLQEARKAILQGLVSRQEMVESDARRIPETDPSAFVLPSDIVFFEGAPLRPRASHSTYLLNKPPGVTSTLADPRGKHDLSYYTKEMAPGTFPIGRLDRATTGLLLLTTDGDLSSSILRPEKKVGKEYWLWLDAPQEQVTPWLERFEKGVPIRQGIARASRAEWLTGGDAYSEISLTLFSGMNRQIRKMCHFAGLHLQHLHRKKIAQLELGQLQPGQFRELTLEEERRLWDDLGGEAQVYRRRLEHLKKESQTKDIAHPSRQRLERWLRSLT
ncbi:MAG: pseudouridine synthase [Polyangiaceae bacterium]|nr:pseudouridine synthase [Polyangiaceae bacterium]